MGDGAPEAALDSFGHESVQGQHTRRALSETKRHLRRLALKLIGYLVLGYLLLRLAPGLKQALHSLAQVSWKWVVAAIALETVSEMGFVLSWRAIVDPEKV